MSAGTDGQSVHVALCTSLVTHVGFARGWALPCSLARPAFAVSEGRGAGCSSPASWGCWLEGLPPPRLGVVIEGFLEDRLCSHVQVLSQWNLQTWGGAERMSLGGLRSPLPLRFRVCFWVALGCRPSTRRLPVTSLIPSGSCPGFTDRAGTAPPVTAGVLLLGGAGGDCIRRFDLVETSCLF